MITWPAALKSQTVPPGVAPKTHHAGPTASRRDRSISAGKQTSNIHTTKLSLVAKTWSIPLADGHCELARAPVSAFHLVTLYSRLNSTFSPARNCALQTAFYRKRPVNPKCGCTAGGIDVGCQKVLTKSQKRYSARRRHNGIATVDLHVILLEFGSKFGNCAAPAYHLVFLR